LLQVLIDLAWPPGFVSQRIWRTRASRRLEAIVAHRSLPTPGSRAKAALAAALVAAAGLGACSTANTSLMSGLSSQSQPEGPAKANKPVLISMPPIVGGSDAYRDAVVRQLNQAATPRNIALVVDDKVPCDYTLRGYMMTQREAGGLKLLYVWDLLDKSGNRINRFTGETTPAAVAAAGDDWAVIPASATGEMADKTVSSLVAWSSSQPGISKL